MKNAVDDFISNEVKDTYRKLSEDSEIKGGLASIESDHDRTVAEQIEITEIPAPPFQEQIRAEHFIQRLRELRLENVQMDTEGNVYGIRPGTGKGPKIFVSAHLDTVFPEGTDTTVTKKDGILYAPGISDDTRGLAELLSVIRAFNETNISTVGDIVFGATVGEEGAGDLRGVKAFFNENHDIDGFLSIDIPEGNNIIYLGTGSFRYKVTYKGPGGHSFGAFGTPSATHALGRAVAEISELRTKEEPKTTFTVGRIQGGTSVNAIAFEASMEVDLRSNDKKELKELADQFLAIVKKAAEDENQRWDSEKIIVDVERFGNRPSARQSHHDIIVQSVGASIESVGGTPRLGDPSSTDANYPMSLGIPSITLGMGGHHGRAHSPDEWFDPKDAYIGVQKTFLAILGLVGVEGISDPLLRKK